MVKNKNIPFTDINKNELLLLKKNFDKKDNKLEEVNNKQHQGCVLNLLFTISERRDSQKTTNTNICQNNTLKLDYDLKEIKKFDELNNSLSDVSEFDLEKDINETKSLFNSSEEGDDASEEEEIFCKKKFIEKKFDNEYEKEVEKDIEEIIKNLNHNNL